MFDDAFNADAVGVFRTGAPSPDSVCIWIPVKASPSADMILFGAGGEYPNQGPTMDPDERRAVLGDPGCEALKRRIGRVSPLLKLA